jgi:hypothetical protein
MDNDRKSFDKKPYGDDNGYGSDYRMDNDRKSFDKKPYGDDNGYESQYQQSYKPDYKPVKDDRDKSKDNKVDIKKIKCNNINININSGNATTGNGDNNNTTNGNGDNGNKTDGFKKINRDGFTFICINNNNNIAGGGGAGDGDGDGNGPFPPPSECTDCFLPTNEGGPVPPGLLTMLNAYLATTPVVVGDAPAQIVGNVAGLCALIDAEGGISEAQIRAILNAALPGGSAPPVIDRIVECLEDLGLILLTAPI